MQQQRHQIPYWIPKDVYLPSSSRSSITTSSVSNNDSGSSNTLNAVDDDEENQENNPQHFAVEDDTSSVWSLSTTSELTFHSHGGIPGPTTTTTTITTPVQVAVQSTYKDLDGDPNDCFGPSFLQDDEMERLNAFPVMVNPLRVVDHDDKGVGCEEDEPLFDPFLVQTGAEDCTSSFTEFYINPVVSSDSQDENHCNINVNKQVSSDLQEEGLLLNHGDSTANEDLPTDATSMEKTCTPTNLNRMDKYQRRHSDLGLVATRRKRRVLIPLHARMEMLSHQTQKPFRSVSRLIVGSVSRLHNRMTRPLALAPPKITSSPRNRFEIFRRNSEMIVTDGYQFESSLSSLPDLRNVDSSETEGTPPLESKRSTSWDNEEEVDEGEGEDEERVIAQFVVDEEHRAQVQELDVAQFVIDSEPTAKVETTYAAQLMEDGEERAKVAADPNTEQNEDLRWLFARQQLPASASFIPEKEPTLAAI